MAVKYASPRTPEGERRCPERRYRADPLGLGEREAQRPPATERRADDRHSRQPQRVDDRAHLSHRVRAQRPPRVVVGVVQPEAREIDGEQTATRQVGQQRRPGRCARAAAVHEQQGRAVFALQHAHSQRRIGEGHVERARRHAVAGEEALLDLLEARGWLRSAHAPTVRER
jgi:hypothetical protein